MRNYSRWAGLIGLIFIILGAFGYAIAPIFKGFYVIPWFLAGCGLIWYLAFNFAEIKGWFSSRTGRYGLGSAVSVLLVIGIICILAVLTARHSKRWDLTSTKLYSLASQTEKVLVGITAEVKATAFFQGETSRLTPSWELLERYRTASPKFSFEIIDPDRNPARARQAGITQYGTVVVASGNQSEKIDNLTEEKLTNAILRVTKSGKKSIYFLVGHGEKDLGDHGKGGYSQVMTKLEEQNYSVKPLTLIGKNEMPVDTAVLVVAGPKKDLLSQEFEAIERFIRQGGKVMFLLEPQSTPELAQSLKRLGVIVGDDVIIDQESGAYGFDYSAPLIQRFTQHPIVQEFKLFSILPLARSISPAPDMPSGVKVVPLAFTGDHAWGETDLAQLNQKGLAKYDPDKDLKGPVPVIVVGTVSVGGEEKKSEKAPTPEGKDNQPVEGKFLVFGDSDFAGNAYLNMVGNSDLFLATVSWLAEERDLVAVRPKTGPVKPLFLTSIQSRLVFWVPAVAIPLTVLLIGLGVVVARRRGR